MATAPTPCSNQAPRQQLSLKSLPSRRHRAYDGPAIPQANQRPGVVAASAGEPTRFPGFHPGPGCASRESLTAFHATRSLRTRHVYEGSDMAGRHVFAPRTTLPSTPFELSSGPDDHQGRVQSSGPDDSGARDLICADDAEADHFVANLLLDADSGRLQRRRYRKMTLQDFAAGWLTTQAPQKRGKAPFPGPFTSGARRDRTDDLLAASEALSQLSYSPRNGGKCSARVEHAPPRPRHRMPGVVGFVRPALRGWYRSQERSSAPPPTSRRRRSTPGGPGPRATRDGRTRAPRA